MRLSRTALALLAAAPIFGADSTLPPATGLTVHEWGTFTSVAQPDGAAASWNPLGGTPDLPCFVIHQGGVAFKSIRPFTVRMETPVLYFYSTRPADVDVDVSFQGSLTEWFPQITVPDQSFSSIGWHLKLIPGPDLEYPVSSAPSHYFAARKTDATPLRVGAQPEKMLFYRGAGTFEPPVSVAFLPDGKMQLRTALAAPLAFAALFENHGGKLAFRLLTQVSDRAPLPPPEPAADLRQIESAMSHALQTAGMYPKEAAAMIETWSDSWFEQGTRLFYIVPRSFVDSTLPIRIDPKPVALERAFMGRVELMPDWRVAAVDAALSSGDVALLEREGRFLQPLMDAARRPGHWNLAPAPAAARFLAAKQQQNAREFSQPSCVK